MNEKNVDGANSARTPVKPTKKGTPPRRDRIRVSLAPGVRKMLRSYLAGENAKPAHAGKKLSRSDVLARALTEFLRSLKRVSREKE